MKTRPIHKTLLVAFALLAFSGALALASHPLIMNGVITAITNTTVQLGDTTFTMLPTCEITFEDGSGTIADVTAAMAANPRLVGVIRRDAPESTNIVRLVVKANKPATQSVPAAAAAAEKTSPATAPATEQPAAE